MRRRNGEAMSEAFKILVVSADEALRKDWASIIRDGVDIHVDEAAGAKDALKKAKKGLHDMILCDRDLQDQEWSGFVRTIKELPGVPSAGIYVIMAAGGDEEACATECLTHGADDFICKPVDGAELLTRVKVGRKTVLRLNKTDIATKSMFREMDVLLIQEGGCAPGYNPVTAFITYHLEGQGRKVYATREGFKSLVTGKEDDFLRLVYDKDLYRILDHIPGVFHAAPLSEWRGAQLRSERYKDFLKPEIQKKAAATIKKRKVRAIIAIGGNGTFKGVQSMCELMPTAIQVFFIPVTIDSDVAGTDCIGQHTGVEMGAEKIRCYMADARTHKRTYILEMMGAQSGFHALHSCLGARAHLAVLPDSEIDHRAVVEAINKRDECVIVVAEGYRKKEREKDGSTNHAAEYFLKELKATGLAIKRKVVCEPFSRDIRGAAPNNQDITLAQRMALNVSSYLKAGTSRLMPAVLSGREYAIPFNEIRTDNMKEKDLLALSNRLTS